MIVNGKEYNIEDLMKHIDVSSHSFRKIGSLMLTNQEIEILERNMVDYKTCSSLKDLRIRIEEILDDEFIESDDADDLEYVLDSIAERDYYENTNK